VKKSYPWRIETARQIKERFSAQILNAKYDRETKKSPIAAKRTNEKANTGHSSLAFRHAANTGNGLDRKPHNAYISGAIIDGASWVGAETLILQNEPNLPRRINGADRNWNPIRAALPGFRGGFIAAPARRAWPWQD
jgi:hypothetical protein